jgi:4-hydroxy-2-oxoheptanedioate aldolase
MLTLILLLAMAVMPTPVTYAQKPQRLGLNSLITLLEKDDKPIFTGEEGYKMYEMEHAPFDIQALRTHMLALKDLDAATVAKTGNPLPGMPVIVRIPPDGRNLDKNLWIVKQVLDMGAQGIVFPHIETPEEALTAIQSMRYPQIPGAPDFEPEGWRGFNPPVPARYWGLSIAEYTRRADVWRLDPLGEMLPIFLIESKRGVQNIREIAKAMKAHNIGVILWVGSGDMAITYCGVPWCENGNQQDLAARAGAPKRGGFTGAAEYQKAELEVEAVGKEFNLPVQINFVEPFTVEERIKQGARLMGGPRPANMK